MRIGVLSGAVKNAGDFLIEKRSVDLIKYHYPDAEICLFQRNQPLDDELEKLNQCDFIVMAGGPLFQPNVYPAVMPLVKDLKQIKPPVFSLGLGWKGKYTDEIYTTYRFSKEMHALIHKMSENAPLSCRDWYTVRALRENGYTDCVMTGCPAWYCLDILQHPDKRRQYVQDDSICISDPASQKNIHLVIPIVKAVRNKFPDSDVLYVVHRDDVNDANLDGKHNACLKDLQDKLDKLGVRTINIARGIEGFSVYDTCRFHIGFRVHAHIYNLSRGKQTILVNEDARGKGVNDALGLENLETEILSRIGENRTGNVRIALQAKDHEAAFQRKIEDYLDMCVRTRGFMYERAWESIREYYGAMCDYMKSWDR